MNENSETQIKQNQHGTSNHKLLDTHYIAKTQMWTKQNMHLRQQAQQQVTNKRSCAGLVTEADMLHCQQPKQ
jgi:hypothetical protein